MRLFGLLGLALAIIVTGCRGDGLNRQPVTGSVKFRGEALKIGTIEFHPESGKGIMEGAGIQNGVFSIPREKGLPPGKYIVRVHAPDRVFEGKIEPGKEPAAPAKELIPAQYNMNSKEIITIESGKENKVDLDLK